MIKKCNEMIVVAYGTSLSHQFSIFQPSLMHLAYYITIATPKGKFLFQVQAVVVCQGE
jgi:hypothetical protein